MFETEDHPWREQFVYYYINRRREVVYLLVDKDRGNRRGWLFMPDMYKQMRGVKMRPQEHQWCSLRFGPCIDKLPTFLVLECSFELPDIGDNLHNFIWMLLDRKLVGDTAGAQQLAVENIGWVAPVLETLLAGMRKDMNEALDYYAKL